MSRRVPRILARLAALLPAAPALLAAAVVLAPAACGRRDEGPPNLVLIIGDDHGYPDSGFMGSALVQTPNLDRLAREGTVFRNGYATASICRPSLRSLLTGLHPVQWNARLAQLRREGVERRPAESILGFTTLPSLLRARGYASFQGGKFWEGTWALAGFDAGMQLTGDGVFRTEEGKPLGREAGIEPVRHFLDAHAGRPFFLWFAPMLPHVPHDPPEAYRALYRGRGLTPDAELYYANVTRLDAVVGELRAELERRGLLERTLLVYVADNGWDQAPDYARDHILLDGPRGKGTLYDLGLRTPVVVRWPGRVPEGVARDELVSSVDLFPTLLDYAGAAVPANLPGASLRPLLEGRGRWERETVIDAIDNPRGGLGHPPEQTRSGRGWHLRNGPWHYLWFEGDGEELYDLSADPREQHDLSRSRAPLAGRFRAAIHSWHRRLR
jgi:uncharacterized sulfatase